jgi:hypothetical protein
MAPLLSFQDYKTITLDWLAQPPPQVQRNYQIPGTPWSGPTKPRGARAARNPELQDAIQAGATDFTAVARASKALARIAPDRADQYDTWVAVGMALSELGRIGYTLWDEWSKRSAK